jgi:linoleoyl-CoA desaturase
VQHLYWPVIYALSAASLLFIRNFKVYFAGRSGETFRYPKMSAADKALFWSFRVVNALIFLVIPSLFFSWPEVIAGFGVTVITAGLVMATVLQIAHVMYAVDFPEPVGDPLHIENEWAVHEVQTTIDFAPNNRFLNWYIGGLNYQIEHHLFPRMCHLNYPRIAPIVREACAEFGITYHAYPTFIGALSAHIQSLKWLGQSQDLGPIPSARAA